MIRNKDGESIQQELNTAGRFALLVEGTSSIGKNKVESIINRNVSEPVHILIKIYILNRNSSV